MRDWDHSDKVTKVVVIGAGCALLLFAITAVAAVAFFLMWWYK